MEAMSVLLSIERVTRTNDSYVNQHKTGSVDFHLNNISETVRIVVQSYFTVRHTRIIEKSLRQLLLSEYVNTNMIIEKKEKSER